MRSLHSTIVELERQMAYLQASLARADRRAQVLITKRDRAMEAARLAKSPSATSIRMKIYQNADDDLGTVQARRHDLACKCASKAQKLQSLRAQHSRENAIQARRARAVKKSLDGDAVAPSGPSRGMPTT